MWPSIPLDKLPKVPVIIVAIGVLVILACIGVKVVMSERLAFGPNGLSLEDLTKADEETLLSPAIIEEVDAALTRDTEHSVEVVEKLQQVQIRQTRMQQQQQQQQQGMPAQADPPVYAAPPVGSKK